MPECASPVCTRNGKCLGWALYLVVHQQPAPNCSSRVPGWTSLGQTYDVPGAHLWVELVLSSAQLCLVFHPSCSQFLLPFQKHFLQIIACEFLCQSVLLRNQSKTSPRLSDMYPPKPVLASCHSS